MAVSVRSSAPPTDGPGRHKIKGCMNKDVRFIAPQSKHLAQLASLLAESFPGIDAQPRRYFQEYFLTNSAYSLRASRIALVDSTIVAHCGVFSFHVRIGKTRLKIGGVGGVFTRSGWQKQGISKRLLEEVLISLEKNRCSVSLLSAIENFYDQFGYVPAWPDTQVKIKVSDLPSVELPKSRRSFKPMCQEFLTTLYNRESKHHVFTAVRPTYTKRIKTDSGAKGCFWKRGYVIGRAVKQTWHVQEVVGDVEQSLAVVAAMAIQHNCPAVVFRGLTGSHPLALELRKYDTRFDTHFRKSGGAMIRLLSLSTFLKAMEKELTARMERSHLSWRGTLNLTCGTQTAALRINRCQVEVATPGKGAHSITGNNEMAQLLIGSFGAEELLARKLISTTGDGLSLANTLFPPCSPRLARGDFF